MTRQSQITAEELREILNYDHKTGIMTWRKCIGRRAKIGAVAGTRASTGHVKIAVHGVPYCAHRLAWLHYYGKLPTYNIDHIDHNPANNSILNLRDVSQIDNMRNRKLASNNTSGVMGVYYRSTKGKWIAQVNVNRKNITLGAFAMIEDAALAREAYERENGYHKNNGR